MYLLKVGIRVRETWSTCADKIWILGAGYRYTGTEQLIYVWDIDFTYTKDMVANMYTNRCNQ